MMNVIIIIVTFANKFKSFQVLGYSNKKINRYEKKIFIFRVRPAGNDDGDG